MYLLPPKTINRWWHLVEPLLSKAWDKTNVGSFLDIDDVKCLLEEEKHYCFISGDKEYAGVFRVKVGSKGNTLYFWLSGGEEPSGGWVEVDEWLQELANVFNCKYIQLEGRLGWKRKVEPFGYKVDSLILIKEVAQ